MSDGLPRFVGSFIDIRGKRRYRFRRVGSAPYYFQFEPGTEKFQLEYDHCMFGSDRPHPDLTALGKARALVDQLRARIGPTISSFVYMIGEDDGPVKIGLALDPANRLNMLQIGNPRPLVLLAVRPGSQRDERRLHREIEPHRISGEWFSREAALSLLDQDVWLTASEEGLANNSEVSGNKGY